MVKIAVARRMFGPPFDPKEDCVDPRRLQLAAQIREAAKPVIERITDDPNHVLIKIRPVRLIWLVPKRYHDFGWHRIRRATMVVYGRPVRVGIIKSSVRPFAIDTDGNVYARTHLRSYASSENSASKRRSARKPSE